MFSYKAALTPGIGVQWRFGPARLISLGLVQRNVSSGNNG